LRDFRDAIQNGARTPALYRTRRQRCRTIDHFFLTSENHIVNHYEHSCNDDLGALDKARELAKNHSIETWQDKRRVALVKKGDAPLSASDARAL
jgi:hypothetical protein